jgi:hypothetical protein
MSKEESLVVVRVTETEFELSDGRIFEHLEPLDIVPSVEEFNETYQHWAKIINNEFTGQANQTR